MVPRKSADPQISPQPDLESTAAILNQIRQGDTTARDRLVSRFLPALQRWARGRLPARARDLADTDDLVQVTLLRALDRVMDFEPQRTGAFFAYLRRILQNQILDHIRRVNRRPGQMPLMENLSDNKPSPLVMAIGKETLEAYEKALAKLTEEQQEAVMLRLELGFTHREVAMAIGSPSANAARMLVARALVRLSEVMDEQI